MAAPLGNKNHLKHGLRNTRLYNIWRSMRQRCSNPKCVNYHNYGGRGISVCSEWDQDFVSFYQWAITNGYSNELCIDRIDCNGNYEPINCRWASYKKQNNNRRSSKYLVFNSQKHIIAEWADITGIKAATIGARLNRGWTAEEALTSPLVSVMPKKKVG